RARQSQLDARAPSLRYRQPDLPSLASHRGGRGGREELRPDLPRDRPHVRYLLHAEGGAAGVLWRARSGVSAWLRSADDLSVQTMKGHGRIISSSFTTFW